MERMRNWSQITVREEKAPGKPVCLTCWPRDPGLGRSSSGLILDRLLCIGSPVLLTADSLVGLLCWSYLQKKKIRLGLINGTQVKKNVWKETSLFDNITRILLTPVTHGRVQMMHSSLLTHESLVACESLKKRGSALDFNKLNLFPKMLSLGGRSEETMSEVPQL